MASRAAATASRCTARHSVMLSESDPVRCTDSWLSTCTAMICSLVGFDFSRELERQYDVRSWQAWYDSTAGPVGTPSSNIT